MRALFLAALLMISPALGDEWQRYENTAYGYSIDIPPGLIWRGESYEGDGQDFTTPTLTLSLQGKRMPDGFEAAIRDWREWETRVGWTFTYGMTTPSAESLRSACQASEPTSGGRRVSARARAPSPAPSVPWQEAHRWRYRPSPSNRAASVARSEPR